MDYKSITAERACAVIDLGAFRANISEVKSRISYGTKLLAVVKANAYGHGAVECSRAAALSGADALAAASTEEALELRRAGITAPILLFGAPSPLLYADIITNNITCTVFDTDTARGLSGAAVALGARAQVHIKIETGMNRVGFDPADIDGMLEVFSLRGLHADGAYTHLSDTFNTDKAFTRRQFEAFMNAVARLEARGVRIPVKHVSNSGAVIHYPEYNLDMVRAGSLIYGLMTRDEAPGWNLAPVMSLLGRIVFVKDIKPGDTVGYRRSYTASGNTRVATVAIGYGDGYPRAMSGKGSAIVHGVICPVIGKVCMDALTLDITGVNAKPGDFAVFIGKQDSAEITAEDAARILDTVALDITTCVTKRTERVFMG